MKIQLVKINFLLYENNFFFIVNYKIVALFYECDNLLKHVYFCLLILD